jgi:hypothetical protein
MTPQQEEWIKEKTKEIGRLWFSEVRLRSAIEAALRAAIEQQQPTESQLREFARKFDKWVMDKDGTCGATVEELLDEYFEQQQGKEDETPQPTGNFTVDLAKWAALLTKKNEQLSAAEAKIKELEAQLIDIDNLRMSADRRVAELEGKRAKPLKVDHPNGKDYGSLFRLQEAIRQLPEHGNQLHGLLCDFLDELEGKERQIAVKRTADNELTICRHDENGTHYVIFAEADDKSHSYVRVGNTPKDYETLQDFWLENILRKFFEFNSSNQKEKE